MASRFKVLGFAALGLGGEDGLRLIGLKRSFKNEYNCAGLDLQQRA